MCKYCEGDGFNHVVKKMNEYAGFAICVDLKERTELAIAYCPWCGRNLSGDDNATTTEPNGYLVEDSSSNTVVGICDTMEEIDDIILSSLAELNDDAGCFNIYPLALEEVKRIKVHIEPKLIIEWMNCVRVMDLPFPAHLPGKW